MHFLRCTYEQHGLGENGYKMIIDMKFEFRIHLHLFQEWVFIEGIGDSSTKLVVIQVPKIKTFTVGIIIIKKKNLEKQNPMIIQRRCLRPIVERKVRH